jgi:hypothetical protein
MHKPFFQTAGEEKPGEELPSGTYFIEENYQNDAVLVLVITGTLSVIQKGADRNESVPVCVAGQGDLVGGFAVFTGEPTFFTVSKCKAIAFATAFFRGVCGVFREVFRRSVFALEPNLKKTKPW